MPSIYMSQDEILAPFIEELDAQMKSHLKGITDPMERERIYFELLTNVVSNIESCINGALQEHLDVPK